jgi:hypothetical protein
LDSFSNPDRRPYCAVLKSLNSSRSGCCAIRRNIKGLVEVEGASQFPQVPLLRYSSHTARVPVAVLSGIVSQNAWRCVIIISKSFLLSYFRLIFSASPAADLHTLPLGVLPKGDIVWYEHNARSVMCDQCDGGCISTYPRTCHTSIGLGRRMLRVVDGISNGGCARGASDDRELNGFSEATRGFTLIPSQSPA